MEATTLIAGTIEELKLLAKNQWIDGEPASKEIDPIILSLENALDKILIGK